MPRATPEPQESPTRAAAETETAVSATHVERMSWTRTLEPGFGGSEDQDPPYAHGEIGRAALIAEAVKAVTWLRRASCGLTGHAMLLQFEPQRLSMRCQDCGEETPGWAIGH